MSKFHTLRLLMTEAAALSALLISVIAATITFVIQDLYVFHETAMALSLILIGLSLFSICFRGCAMSDNHHWRMFMGIIFVLWGIDLVLPNSLFRIEFNDIITVLFVLDIFLIIYDNSSIILGGPKVCKVDKKK